MKKRFFLLALAQMIVVSALGANGDLKLMYDKPATVWEEALPLGNGFIGAMMYGGVDVELIRLNESSLWSGLPVQDGVNPDSYKHLNAVRKALANKDYAEANRLCKLMQGHYSESYLPLGDLRIEQTLPTTGDVMNYKRELMLADAMAMVKFNKNGVEYKRTAFVSAPDSVMVVKFEASREGSINLKLTMASQLQHTFANEGGVCKMQGNAPARLDPVYYNVNGRNPMSEEEDGHKGMRWQAALKVVNDGGKVQSVGDCVTVTGANSVVVYLSAATSFNGPFKYPDTDGKDEKAINNRRLAGLSYSAYDKVKDSHIADFRKYFDRVELNLCDKDDESLKNMPTNERLMRYSKGETDLRLEETYCQFGRYLLISCSRPGGVTANLQGIWNKEYRAPWSSNYTININTEMNYWPSETANLSEMHQPMLDWVKNLSVVGERVAKEYYNLGGWMAHHNSDIWCLANAVGDCGNGDPLWANWYAASGWLCQDLWERYAFTGDKEYLANHAYPVMKKAADFFCEWLVPKGKYLITSPSTSPENAFLYEGKAYSVTEGCTMDYAIIRDLFGNVIEATKVLGIDKKYAKKLEKILKKLPPYQIGSEGQLLEWSEEYAETDRYHRHLSHMYALHPGKSISPLTTPELAKAADKTLAIRGDAGTGWSKGWKINFAARLLDGDHAYKMIREIMSYVDPVKNWSGGTYPNMFDAHPPFQIDGNFGATAGVTEMLLQSHFNEVFVLPALPQSWKEGSVKGLKARGNFEVSIDWAEGCLKSAEVKSVIGGKCTIRSQWPVTIEGVNATEVTDGKYYLYTFDTQAGKVYKAVAK